MEKEKDPPPIHLNALPDLWVHVDHLMQYALPQSESPSSHPSAEASQVCLST
ncbi:hypothetical protein [Oryza sativa Japonica Group]|uniref:Uncharacterized protein n=1 Tax=Oryza sativa subsp. japonica TaxID=39947 RepID=Q5N8H0_ORYSJ|nr:hypothetical protein [Oryza sativa Japonica Group]BAD82236.1 hypothetical protein [Oryza sativa Japonica Group]